MNTLQTLVPEPILDSPLQTSIRRFSLEEYHRLIALNFFDDDDRIELIDGIIVPMSSPKPRHAETLDLVLYSLSPLYAQRGVLIRVQSPITLPGQQSEPQPDLTVICTEGRGIGRHPLPHETLLVVEVSDITLASDQRIKATRYAAAGILEYWIINLVANRLEVYQHPRSLPDGMGEYQSCTFYRSGDTVTLLAFPDHEVTVSTFLFV